MVGKSVPQPPFNSILKTNQVPIQIVKGTWNFSTISNFSGRRTTSENSFQFDLSLNYRDFHSLESSYIMTLFNEQLCCGFLNLYVMTVLGFIGPARRENICSVPPCLSRGPDGLLLARISQAPCSGVGRKPSPSCRNAIVLVILTFLYGSFFISNG